jgi:hypothetical protein
VVRIIISLALLALVLPAARAQEGGAEPPEVTRIRESVPRLQKKLEALRGEKFTRDVAVHYQSDADFRAYMQKKLDAEYPPEKAQADARLLSALGYLPAGFDLRAGLVEAMSSQALAHYDPATDAFYVLKTAMPASEIDAAVLHELHHALQDQRHDLGTTMKPFESPDFTDEDQVLAFRCLVEGEAFYLQLRFALEQQGMAAMLEQVLQLYSQSPRRELEEMERGQLAMAGDEGKAAADALEARAKLPGYLYNQIVSPYFKGGLAVKGYHARGGWKTIDGLFKTLPRSTEQVLHPEKALEGPKQDLPTPVELPDLSAQLGEGWTKLVKKTFGELQLRVLFETLTGEEQADACAGWDGDQAHAYGKGEATAYVWFLVFDSEADAQEFARAFNGAFRAGTDLERTITTRGAHVLVVGGVAGDQAAAVSAAALEGVQLR